MTTINDVIKKGTARIERKAYIKRMTIPSGAFESSWIEISNDVKKFGKIKTNADSVFANRTIMSALDLVLSNESGRYNPEDDQSSLWYNYCGQQRTLIKVEAKLVDETKGSDGIWVQTKYPQSALWDVSQWDNCQWDERGANFIGLISGDPFYSSQNEMSFTVKPISFIFQEFPASNLNFYTSTGMTASEFITGLRDMIDGGGNYVFRPFFQNTTDYWSISSTTNIYTALNTTTSEEVIDKTVWDVIEKLMEAENYLAFVKKNGVFYFGPKTQTASPTFEFCGANIHNATYGQTIKSIQAYGKNISKYYSRVVVKFNKDDTVTSYVTKAADFSISSNNLPWRLGFKTLNIDNEWIGNTVAADAIATAVFNEVSAIAREIKFTTVFIPHLDVLDQIKISYDASNVYSDELWDCNDWNTELTWARPGSDGLILDSKQFKIIEQAIDLDKLECSYVAREI